MSEQKFNEKKFLISGLFGGVISFFTGWLVYGVLLMNIMGSNSGPASNVMRGPKEMLFWAIFLGSLFMGFTLSYIFNKWANINTLAGGAVAGASVGFMITAGYDFINYGTTNLMSISGTCIDLVAGTVVQAIIGAAVGWMNSKVKAEK
ncbi:MAG: hypothetical protein K2Q21_05475 [Chitinophagaceae bacterium]|nr:hypothetical protein [Chitinophagaceae bacterium]